MVREARPGSVGPVSDVPSSAGSYPAYPGERLGLPKDGPGAVAGWTRRLVAIFVDWVASTLVATFLFGYQWFGETAGEQGLVGAAPLLVFLVEATVLTALLGGSFGQLALRVHVVRLDGRPVGLLESLVRTFLILLVVPPLIFNRDQRGLHDMLVRTVTVRR